MTKAHDEMVERGALEVLQMVTFDLDEEAAHKALAATEHRGDCNDESFTCIFCHASEARDIVKSVHFALKPADLALLVQSLPEDKQPDFQYWLQRLITETGDCTRTDSDAKS